MKQFNIISKLLSTLISPEELMEIVEKHQYKSDACAPHNSNTIQTIIEVNKRIPLAET